MRPIASAPSRHGTHSGIGGEHPFEGIRGGHEGGVAPGPTDELQTAGQSFRQSGEEADRREAEQAPRDAVLGEHEQELFGRFATRGDHLRGRHRQEVDIGHECHEPFVQLATNAKAAHVVGRRHLARLPELVAHLGDAPGEVGAGLLMRMRRLRAAEDHARHVSEVQLLLARPIERHDRRACLGSVRDRLAETRGDVRFDIAHERLADADARSARGFRATTRESAGSAVRTSMSNAMSRTLRAIGASTSMLHESVIHPSTGTSPVVGRNPTAPLSAGGTRIDARVSVPSAPRAMPVTSEMTAPPLDPPGTRDMSHGLWDWGVVTPSANSCVTVLPRINAPAARSLATACPSVSGSRGGAATELPVVRKPTASITSLMPIGMP